MNRIQVINHRQLAWLIAAVITAGGQISVQQEVIRIARMDAWFAYFLPLIYGIGVAWILFALMRRFPGKNLFQIVQQAAGPLVGTVLNALLLVYIWLILIRDLSAISQFIKSILLPNTPFEMVLLLLVLLLIQFGRTSIEVAARVNDIIFPLYVLSVFAIPLLLCNEINIDFLQPFLAQPPERVLSSSTMAAGWFGDIFVAGAFLSSFNRPKQFISAMKHGIVLASVMLTLMIAAEVMTLSAGVTGNLVYPSYTLFQQVHVSDFLDRVDLAILSLWFPTVVIKLVVIYMAWLTCLGSMLKTRHYRLFNTPMAMLAVPTTMSAFDNSAEAFSFSNFCSTFLAVTVQLPILLLVLIVTVIRTKPPTPQDKQESGGSKKKGAQLMSQWSRRLVERYSYSSWVWLNRALAAVCLTAIIVGLTYGRYAPAVGTSCAVVFSLSLFVSMFGTYLEMQRAI